MIQLRCKDASTRELLRHLRSLKKFEVPVIINDRVDLAAEADGVHLGLEDLPITRARRALGEKAIIGATTHSLREARGAVASGADYISVGPLYPTPLKPDLPARGFTYLRAARTLGVPVFCIGGICEENIREAVRRGCDRVAVSRGVLESPDPCRSARLLRRALADG